MILFLIKKIDKITYLLNVLNKKNVQSIDKYVCNILTIINIRLNGGYL